MSIQGTVIAEAVVVEGCTVLVEFSDGTLKQYQTEHPYGAARRSSAAFDPNSVYGSRTLRFKTPEQIRNLIHDWNRDVMDSRREALHMDKVRRLGWDYAQRGY